MFHFELILFFSIFFLYKYKKHAFISMFFCWGQLVVLSQWQDFAVDGCESVCEKKSE